MTLTLAPHAPTVRKLRTTALTRESAKELVEGLCAICAVAGLAAALWHSGGRDRGAADFAMLLAAPSIVASRAWRRLSRLELVLAAALVAAVALVPFATPLGVSEVRDANAYTYGVVFYLAARGYVVTRQRRRLMTAAVLVVAAAQLVPVWRVWIGEHNPGYMMVGTFYWHNQFGAFAAGIALFSVAHVMRSRAIDDLLAWLVAPLFVTLTVLSHSRGAMLALVLGGSVLAAVAVFRHAWLPLLRLGVVAAVALIVRVSFLTAVRGQGGGAAAQAISPDSLSSTSGFRWTAGKAALHVVGGAPFVSRGFGTFGIVEPRYVPAGGTTSRWAHSAELQAFTDGGVLLGLPVIAFVVLALIGSWRCMRPVLQPVVPCDWSRVGAAAAGVAVIVHTSMDFDTQYPVLVAMVALFVALALSPRANETPHRHVWRLSLLRGAGVAVIAASCALTSVMVASYWRTADRVHAANVDAATNLDEGAIQAAQAMHDGRFTDPRPAILLVRLRDRGAAMPPAQLSAALRASMSYAHLDAEFESVWQRVDEAAGRPLR